MDWEAEKNKMQREFDNALSNAVALWALADKLLMPTLQNRIVDWIHWGRVKAKIVPTAVLNDVYRCTGPGSQLRRLFVENCARGVPNEWYLKHPEQFPQEMLLELATYFSVNFSVKGQAEEKESFHVKVMKLFPNDVKQAQLTPSRMETHESSRG